MKHTKTSQKSTTNAQTSAKTQENPTALYAVIGYEKDGRAWNLGTKLEPSQALAEVKKAFKNPIFKGVSVREMEL